MLLQAAFYGRGEHGPEIFMTDDSTSEKESLKYAFPNSEQILCFISFSPGCMEVVVEQQ